MLQKIRWDRKKGLVSIQANDNTAVIPHFSNISTLLDIHSVTKGVYCQPISYKSELKFYVYLSNCLFSM